MSSFRTLARTTLFAALFLLRSGFGAPALTTVQDVLYKADGTRFNGTLYITWTNFQSGDASMVPVQGLTIPVVNGAFKVDLIPTTTASPGANYTVVYSSQGKYQFTEKWAVPPSTLPVRVRDIRIATGTQVGISPPVLTQIVISDVTGLPNELSIRPSKGVAFQPARAAVINTSGQLDAASGNLSDCVRVDGTSGPCGTSSGGSGSFSFADGETPAGIVDGVNSGFGLAGAPSPAASLALYRNGLYMRGGGVDYTLNGSSITFVPAAIPQPGDVLAASYRTVAAAGPLAAYSTPEVICSAAGGTTAAATPASLGTCTIRAGVLRPGDRILVEYDFGHQGSQSSFAAQVAWGNSTIAALSAAAGDSVLAGKSSLAVIDTGAQWSTQGWTGAGVMSASAGLAPDSTAASLTIRFSGSVSAASGDMLALRNFTVTRQPAQANP